MYGDYEERSAPGGNHAVIGLIAVNVVFYIISQLSDSFAYNFALVQGAVSNFEIWRFLSAIFLHVGLDHLFFNMIGLLVFGSILQNRAGGGCLIKVYLLSGIAGNILFYILNLKSQFYLFGASGAVTGILAAAAMTSPNTEMFMLFIPFPIKIRTLAIVYLAIDVVQQMLSYDSSIAYFAHIGGFIAAVFYMIIFYKELVLWNPLGFLSDSKQNNKNDGNTFFSEKKSFSHDSRANIVNKLLKKLSEEGINSLTEEEQSILWEARKDFMNGNDRR